MRKIEEQMIAAVRRSAAWKVANTAVEQRQGGVYVYLHGNLIARMGAGTMEITLAGWNTRTTRSRVNALLRAFGHGTVYQCKGLPFYSADGVEPIPFGSEVWVTVR